MGKVFPSSIHIQQTNSSQTTCTENTTVCCTKVITTLLASQIRPGWWRKFPGQLKCPGSRSAKTTSFLSTCRWFSFFSLRMESHLVSSCHRAFNCSFGIFWHAPRCEKKCALDSSRQCNRSARRWQKQRHAEHMQSMCKAWEEYSLNWWRTDCKECFIQTMLGEDKKHAKILCHSVSVIF